MLIVSQSRVVLRQISLKIICVLSVIALFGLYVWANFPGYMSHDSSVHYRQVLSGDWTTFQPVIFLALWKGTDVLLAGPGGLFLLFMLVFAVGLLLFLWGGQIKVWQKLLFLCLVMLAPINLMLLPHLWKDVALMAFLMLALGLFVQFNAVQKTWLKYATLISLACAISFRFEAVLYLWPLIFYVLWQENDDSKFFWKSGGRSALFLATVFMFNGFITWVSDAKKITLWPTMALWDLAAVSIEINENLLPDFVTGPGMTVADLDQAFKPWSNVPLLSRTQAGIKTGIELPYKGDEYRTLKKAWLQLPFTQTSAYLKHRWRLFKELLRINETNDKPKELYYVHKVTGFQADFPKNNSKLNQKYSAWMKQNIDAFYFKPWFYLLLGALACVVFVFRYKKAGQANGLFLCLSACAFLNVMVMLFLAPAAETRYLIVAMNFSLMLWVLVFSAD